MNPPKIYTEYDPPTDPGIDCTVYIHPDGTVEDCPSKTQQQFKDDCDIYKLLERALRTGELEVNRKPPLWGDFTSVEDYRASLDLIRQAQEDFNALDAHVRDRFANDPANLLAFVQDAANRDEAIRLGIAEQPPPAAPEVAQGAAPVAVPSQPLPLNPPPGGVQTETLTTKR